MKSIGFSNLYRISLRFPYLVLGLGLLATFISIWATQRIGIEMDFAKLLPSSAPSVQNFSTYTEYFGSNGYLYLTVEHEDPALAEKFADSFAPALQALPNVRYVDYRQPVEFFRQRFWYYLDLKDLSEMEKRVDRSLELQKRGVSPVFSELMDFAEEDNRPDLTFQDIQNKYKKKYSIDDSGLQKGESGKMIVMRVKARTGSENLDENKKLVEAAQTIEAEMKLLEEFRGIQVGYAGTYMTSIETVALVRREMTMVSILVGTLLLIILFLYFKRFSGALLVGLPLLMGVAWTGGLIYALFGRVNVLTAFSLSILSGLGSDYGIYLLARFFKETDQGLDFNQACYKTFAVTGHSTWMAVLVTMAAFGALLFSKFDLFFEFGMIGASGLFLTYLAMMLILPALLTVARRYPKNRLLQVLLGHGKRIEFSSRGNSSWVETIFQPRAARSVLLVFLSICILAVFSVPSQARIYLEEGQLDFQNIPSNRLYHRIAAAVGNNLHPGAILVRGPEAEAQLFRGLNKLIEKGSPDGMVLKQVLGLSTFLPEEIIPKQEILRRLLKKYPQNRFVNEKQKEEFVKSVADTLASKPPSLESLPLEVTRNFVSFKDPNLFSVLIFPSISRDNNEDMRRYNKGVLTAIEKVGTVAQTVDNSFINEDILDIIEAEAPRGLLFVLSFLLVVLLFSLKNFKRSILIFSQLIASLILLCGILYLTDIKLNILNIAVFPIILGTGIDCFIHFSHHFDESPNLAETIRGDIPPILVSNLTSIIGFGGLLFTSSASLRSIGWVSVIGLLLMSLVCTFIFSRLLSLPFFAGRRPDGHLKISQSWPGEIPSGDRVFYS